MVQHLDDPIPQLLAQAFDIDGGRGGQRLERALVGQGPLDLEVGGLGLRQPFSQSLDAVLDTRLSTQRRESRDVRPARMRS